MLLNAYIAYKKERQWRKCWVVIGTSCGLVRNQVGG